VKKKETAEEMEKRDAAGYARIPSEASEYEEWESDKYGLRMKTARVRRHHSRPPGKRRR